MLPLDNFFWWVGALVCWAVVSIGGAWLMVWVLAGFIEFIWSYRNEE
jgi:hypothetical protein